MTVLTSTFISGKFAQQTAPNPSILTRGSGEVRLICLFAKMSEPCDLRTVLFRPFFVEAVQRTQV